MSNGLLFFPGTPYQSDGEAGLTEAAPEHRAELARVVTADLAAVEA